MQRFFPRRFLALGILAIALIASATSTARAGVLFYSGNFDLNDAAPNMTDVPINIGGSYLLEKALVYENFVVPVGQTWAITNLFSNNQMAYYVAPTTATWEIRSGMSAGQGGTLVASGDTAATATLMTPADGNNYIDPEYRISATVSNLTLTAGSYWMAVAPDSLGYYGDQSYIETTSGANSVGNSTGTSFLNNNLNNGAKLTFAASSLNFSAGVIGTNLAVPEPASAMMLAAGLSGVSLLVHRRRSQPTNTPTV